MPSASEVKKIDSNWESKVTDISTGNLWGDLEQINREIEDCNEAVADAGLGGISYASQNSEIQHRMNAIGTMEQYVMGIRSALQQQLDDPLFEGFNKKATETLSRIHPEKFQTSNTLGLTVTLGASGHGESYTSKEKKDYLDLYDFLGYTVGNYSEYGCMHTESMECVQDFADMFKADYDAASKSGALKGSNVKCLDDYLKNLVNGGDFSHQMDQPFKSFLSGLLDITIVKPIIDACTGYDCITGEDLSSTDQTLDLIFAAVSLIPFAGVAGKAIEIGGKEGALFLGKRVAVDCASYAASYSAGKLAEQKGLDPRINVLISLGIGITATKVAGKYILKDSAGKTLINVEENTRTHSTVEQLTSDSIKTIIEKHGISVDSFSKLLDPDRALNIDEINLVGQIRNEIGTPPKGTVMSKIIPQSDIYKYLYDQNYKSIRGFVSVDEHSKSLNGLDSIFEGNRLDYNGTNFKTDYGVNGVSQSIGTPDIVYGKITYVLKDPDSVKIPTELVTEDNIPYTGRGFTGSKRIILPELVQQPRSFTKGDVLKIYDSKSGNLIQQFKLDKKLGWVER